ncbi:hypothetical protein [Tunturiibacter psychrotolerans]
MDPILAPNLRTPMNDTIVVDYDYWLAILLGWNTQTQTGIFFYTNMVA